MSENTIRLHKGLQEIFGHLTFKSLEQKLAAEAIYLGNNNVLIQMPRRSGKSLCYQLPIALRENSFALVFSPRISYVKKQVDYLLSKKIPSFYWGTNKSIQIRIKYELESDCPTIKLLYLTPHQGILQIFQYISRSVKPGRLAYIVLDDCHCLSRQSQDFRDDYQEFYMLRSIFAKVPFILMDSVIMKQEKQEIYQTLRFTQSLEVSSPLNTPDLLHDTSDTILEVSSVNMSSTSNIENHSHTPENNPTLTGRLPVACMLEYSRNKLYQKKPSDTHPDNLEKTAQSPLVIVHKCSEEDGEKIVEEIRSLLNETRTETSTPILISSEVDPRKLSTESLNTNTQIHGDQDLFLHNRKDPRVMLRKLKNFLYKFSN
ncbi:hypothetical protein QAD02_024426 [Eretmocerus hayati]|uniref:Uncharacterized protein n=1 Tax=Eretmocerus hayati TaxID=131215 RepID=A0ACC2Q0W2_9HYME|nr:hypothetical protein QAD02_024426 [Eretmocerus hayati]